MILLPVVFEAGFLISQISQQVAKYPLAKAMDASVQRPNYEIWDKGRWFW